MPSSTRTRTALIGAVLLAALLSLLVALLTGPDREETLAPPGPEGGRGGLAGQGLGPEPGQAASPAGGGEGGHGTGKGPPVPARNWEGPGDRAALPSELEEISRKLAPFRVRVQSAAPDGRPLPGARVNIADGITLKECGEAGKDGWARFFIPVRFKASLVVSARGFLTVRRDVFSRDRDGAREVTVVLSPFGETPPAILLVVDHVTGAPIPGAPLCCEGPGYSASDLTDDEGRASFTLEALARPVRVRVEAAGYHPRKGVAGPPQSGADWVIRLVPDLPLEVRVLSGEGFPLPGVEVLVQSRGPSWAGKILKSETDGAGLAVFRGFALDVESSIAVGATREGSRPLERTVTIEDYLGSKGSFTVRFAPGLELRGCIENMGDFPGGGLYVEYAEEGEGSAFFEEGAPVRTAAVDGAGGFALSGLGDGAVRLRIRSAGEVFMVLSGLRLVEENLAVRVPDPALIRIVVTGGSRVPVAGAPVVLLRQDPGFPGVRKEGSTNASGVFAFLTASPGRLQGSVSAQGFLETGFEFEAPPAGAEKTVDVVLQPAEPK